MGLITANSFMKREFGSKLIEELIPKMDLTHVIDTSGAYIPGHGTPTVILFGRNRRPASNAIRAVLGNRGEPSTPEDPSQGKVWRSLVEMLDTPGAENEFISVVDAPRETFHRHPWSLGGGGASDLRAVIERESAMRLEDLTQSIGFHCITKQDDVFLQSYEFFRRIRAEKENIKPFGIGEDLRDWSIGSNLYALFPYDEKIQTFPLEKIPILHRFIWPFRSNMGDRKVFGGQNYFESGKPWWEYGQIPAERFQTPLSIAFAFVATHNHFVLDRGGKVFNRSAPIIKLPPDKTEDDHLALLGLLNSSLACFWLKATGHNKGFGADQSGARTRDLPFEDFYEISGTQLGKFPVASAEKTLAISRELDSLSRRSMDISPHAIIDATVPSREVLDKHRAATECLFMRRVALQEELDWLCYRLYGILDKDEAPLHEIATLPEVRLGERAFEIAISRKTELGEMEAEWFRRHNARQTAEIPDHWPESYRVIVERRIRLIEENQFISLLERPEYKRRWQREPWEEQEARALRTWLLDRFETPAYWPKQELTSASKLADTARNDADFMQVAALYRGRADFDVTSLVSELVTAEGVPFLSSLRYTATGLRKRREWEETWELQRREDKGEKVGKIAVPSKYTSADFQGSACWRLRGKLDVPKERFILYPLAERDADPTPVTGWAGWNHLEQAKALAAYYVRCSEIEGWTAERLMPLLAGVAELIPWLLQWHNDIDDETGERLGNFYEGFLDEEARSLGRTVSDLRAWAPAAKTRATRKAGGRATQ